MDILQRIKHLVMHGYVDFTAKAIGEQILDGLEPVQVVESILNARKINKTLRSRSTHRQYAGEKLYVIKSFSDDGALIYSKDAIRVREDTETFYILVSSKVSTD